MALTIVGGFLASVSLAPIFLERVVPEEARWLDRRLILGVAGVGLTIMTLGVARWVILPGIVDPGAAAREYGSHRLTLMCVGFAGLAGVAGPPIHAALGLGGSICSVSGVIAAALGLQVAMVAVFYARVVRPGMGGADPIGLRSRLLPWHIGLGFVLGGWLLILNAVIGLTLRWFGVVQTQIETFRCLTDLPGPSFAAVVLIAGVIVPTIEELFFRGFVFRSYLATKGPWIAYPASALLFGAVHANLPALLPISVMAVVLGFAVQKTGSLVPSIIAHAVNNTVAFAMLYLSRALNFPEI